MYDRYGLGIHPNIESIFFTTDHSWPQIGAQNTTVLSSRFIPPVDLANSTIRITRTTALNVRYRFVGTNFTRSLGGPALLYDSMTTTLVVPVPPPQPVKSYTDGNTAEQMRVLCTKKDTKLAEKDTELAKNKQELSDLRERVHKFEAEGIGHAQAVPLKTDDSDDGFKLVKFSGKKSVCLDGTPGGFLWRQGTQPSSVVVHMEGGERWCYNEADCMARSKTDIGSSKGWKSVGDMCHRWTVVRTDCCRLRRLHLSLGHLLVSTRVGTRCGVACPERQVGPASVV